MRRIQVAVVALLLAAGSAQAQQVTVPEGFTWHPIEELKAHILVPPSWIAVQSAEGGVIRLAVSPKRVDGATAAGYLLEAHPRLTSGHAAQLAQDWVRAALQGGRQVGTIETLQVSTLSGLGGILEVDRPADEGGPYRRAVSALGNTATNTVYYMSFTASLRDWDALWSQAGWIMGHFRLDDEV